MIQRPFLPQMSPLYFNHSLEGMLLTRRGEEMHQRRGYAAASNGLRPFPLLWELGCVTPCRAAPNTGCSRSRVLPLQGNQLENCEPRRQYLGKITFQSCLFPTACTETLCLTEGNSGSRSVHPFLRVGSKTLNLMPKNGSLSKVTGRVMLYNLPHL